MTYNKLLYCRMFGPTMAAFSLLDYRRSCPEIIVIMVRIVDGKIVRDGDPMPNFAAPSTGRSSFSQPAPSIATGGANNVNTTPEFTLDSFLNVDWFGLPHLTLMGSHIRPQHIALVILLVAFLGPINGLAIAAVLFANLADGDPRAEPVPECSSLRHCGDSENGSTDSISDVEYDGHRTNAFDSKNGSTVSGVHSLIREVSAEVRVHSHVSKLQFGCDQAVKIRSEMTDTILYFLSSDIDLDIKIHLIGVCHLQLDIPVTKDMSLVTTPLDHELYITCDLFMNGVFSIAGRTRSTYKCFPFDQNIIWNEWLTIPLKYKDVQLDAALVFTVWNACTSNPVGGSTIPIFCEKGTLRFGLQKMHLWMERAGHISETPFNVGVTVTPIEANIHAYAQKPLPVVQWLDKLLVPVIEKSELITPSDGPILLIEFPDFPHPIVYHDKPYNLSVPSFPDLGGINISAAMRRFYDPETDRNAPIDDKYKALSRSWVGTFGLKPKLSERDQIQKIIASPSKILQTSEKAILWKFREYISDDKRALTKFLRCVNWADTAEVDQAVDLLEKWSPIDTADALELLSSFFSNTDVRHYAVERLARGDDRQLDMYLLQLVQAIRFEKDYPSDLSRFLVRRCSSNVEMATHMHWFVHIEQTGPDYGALYSRFQSDFLLELESREESASFLKIIANQHEFCDQLNDLALSIKNKTYRSQKERLNAVLSEGGTFYSLRQLSQSVLLPLVPSIIITGVMEVDVFKSSMAPLGLLCSTTDGVPYRVMFKNGDDLRQDQFIIQMINLMDQILKRVNLDLRLSPYRVLAISSSSGFVELVPDCKNLRAILSDYGASNNAIRLYFENACGNRPNELQPILDCFIKSCAGYCVITYILGIGDRHLDNLLVTQQGHLFHIDFGFAFGRDPKPFPPPMKLCKEMVDAMGGSKSALYRSFEAYCCQAFNILRKSASLILNLLSLMADSGIQDLAGDAAERNLIRVQEKFRLDLSDEEAEQIFLNLITESVTALFPQVIDRIHNWALYWK